MDVTLLSGVVRNRKVAQTSNRRIVSFDGTESSNSVTTMERVWDYLSGSALLRNFKLRVHKFTFQWDLVLHLSVCIASLTPFSITGKREYAIIPISVWVFYNALFLIGTRRANLVVPNFGKFKHTFKASVEEFFSPKLLPVLSISFLLVALSLCVTGRRLGGPPLCYSSCGKCLSLWNKSAPLTKGQAVPPELAPRVGCGYLNGKEMLGYYTMAQTSFLLFGSVLVAMAVCMAWRIAEEEIQERQDAEEWLKREDAIAFKLRDDIMRQYGSPASPIRPEGNAVWVIFGIVAALTFTLLGWHNWYVLPPSHTATLLIVLNLLTILLSTLILHLGFFGRLLALYKRNLLRVQGLTKCLEQINENEIDAWWNCRSFVLNEDLALDYDIGGLAVSATFTINIAVFIVLVVQTARDGFLAMMEPPGSYCAYACLYITMCLIKIFSLATETFEEQYRHINGLQHMSSGLGPSASQRSTMNSNNNNNSSWSLDYTEEELAEYGVAGFGPAFAAKPASPSNTNNRGKFGEVRDDSKKEGDYDYTLENEACASEGGMTPTRDHDKSSSQGRRDDESLENGAASSQGQQQQQAGSAGKNKRAGLLSQPLDLISNISTGLLRRGNLSTNNNNNHKPSATSATAAIAAAAGVAGGDVDMESGKATSDGGSGGGASDGTLSLSAGAPASAARMKLPNRAPSLNDLNTAVSASASAGEERPSRGPRYIEEANRDGTGRGLIRAVSVAGNLESKRQTFAEMISQIRKYDPYPCILGIPVMPALFSTCKFYIFVVFLLIGTRIMVASLRNMALGEGYF